LPRLRPSLAPTAMLSSSQGARDEILLIRGIKVSNRVPVVSARPEVGGEGQLFGRDPARMLRFEVRQMPQELVPR
jgi:hypothetical protein